MQNNQEKKMKTLIIYATSLFMLPAFAQIQKTRIKPEDFKQFKSTSERKALKWSFDQRSQFAHEKKTYNWDELQANWNYQNFTEFEYTVDGLVKSEINYDANNNPINKFKRTYDSKQRLVLQEEYYFDNSEWKLAGVDEHVFDAKDREILSERRVLNGSEWEVIFGFRYIIENPTVDQEIIINQTFDVSAKNYVNTYKEVVDFENGKKISHTNMKWIDNEWVNESAEAYDYDANGIITAILNVTWNGTQWENKEMIYDIVWMNATDELPLEYVSKLWNGTGWLNENKTMFNYLRNGGIIATSYKFENDAWKEAFRYVDEFDDFKNRSKLKIEVFEQNNWIVQFESRYEHTYDAQQRLRQTITKMFDGLTWKNLLKEEYDNYKIGTGISAAKSLSVSVYPNPTTEKLNIQLNDFNGTASVQVMDLSGKVVMSTEIDFSSDKSINVTELLNGIYILSVNADNKNYTQKFIKE